MILVRNLSKGFKLYRSPADRLKEVLLRRPFHRGFQALRDISFEVREGEILGVIGQNGSGKSTLLKLLAGILLPDAGSIWIDGRITGLLELGTGFHPEFSGRQNIYLNADLLGMPRTETEKRIEEIISFAEIGDFMEEPLKTYSSGMAMRLAFSIAVHSDPKAFVVDEILSVGDAYFQQKCLRKIREFQGQGGAIVFVSHDMNSIKLLCNRVLLLEEGRVVEEGEPERVINTYHFLLAKKASGEKITLRNGQDSSSYGNFKVEIKGVRMMDEFGQEGDLFESGRPITLNILLRSNQDMESVTVGILFRDRFGQDIYGTNSCLLGRPIPAKKGDRLLVSYAFDELNLGPGKYTLTVAAHSLESHVEDCYHWIDAAKSFEVLYGGDSRFIGLARLNPRLLVERVE